MGMLDDVGTYMAANVTDVTLPLGTNLFLGRLPDSPDTCGAIYETAGGVPDDVFGADSAPPIENAGLMCHTRATSYSTCQSLAVDIMKTLSKVINETLTSTAYYKIEATQSPFWLMRDDQERMLCSCNFTAVKAL